MRFRFHVYDRADLGLCPVSDRRRCIVTTSLIGWVHAPNQHWYDYLVIVLNLFPWLKCWCADDRDHLIHYVLYMTLR